jgi:N-acetyldiaminopimelate deacetylase
MKMNPLELRHKLHQNPELSFNEIETTKLLIDSIKTLDNSEKILIHTPYKTGLLVEYKYNDENFSLFRADIDALPIKEKTNAAFKSKNNFMHACGHDVHTSILFDFLGTVLKENIKKNILFLFQPAEESGGGAMKFFKTGIFKNYQIVNAFALHVTDDYPKGTIASTKGVLFASSLEVNIDFEGVSSHVAFPTEGKNAFNALRLFVDLIDQMPRDNSDPFVFGIGKISAGEVRNIIPGYARLEGTMRGLSKKKVLDFYKIVEEQSLGIQQATGVKIKFEQGPNYPEVIVNPELYDKLIPELSSKFNFIDCGYKMTGEDFGFISHQYPSFMFWLGTSTGENHGLHNPNFLPDDDVIDIGKSVLLEILKKII